MKKELPENSAVFDTTDGRRIRVEYEKIFSYYGKIKSNTTTIEYGYYDNRETFILDIDFNTLDDRLTEYRQAIRDYYESASIDSY